jgi:sorting nexin-4
VYTKASGGGGTNTHTEYIKGDRFSSEFVEKRRLEWVAVGHANSTDVVCSLQRFVDRIASHPTLQRSQIVIDFLTTEEWTVVKHKHIANPPPESHSSLMDSLSDGLVNMFTRVRKPDARFVDMNDGLERFEDGLGQVERLVARSKNRVDGEMMRP